MVNVIDCQRILQEIRKEAEHTMNYLLKGKYAKPVKVKLVEVEDE